MRSQSECTPGIIYLSGSDLLAHSDRWYAEVEAATRGSEHLLTKTRAELEPAARAGLVTIAIDTTEGDRMVGCIVLWELERNDGVMWYELGTFLVVPDHRFKARGPKAMPIGDFLTRHLLEEHAGRHIMCTTDNPAAAHTFVRDGMRVVSFHDLPSSIHGATCICPLSKTGTSTNRSCRLKNGPCHAFVSYNTWERMGCPDSPDMG